MVKNIESIVTLMQGTQDANATAAQILNGYSAYAKGSKVTGNIPSQGAQTITPGTADKTIAAGRYLSGAQTIKGDANLVAANIAKGKTIFGVTGTAENGLPNFYSTETSYNKNRGINYALKKARFVPVTGTYQMTVPAGPNGQTQMVTANWSAATYDSSSQICMLKPEDESLISQIDAVLFITNIQMHYSSSVGWSWFRTFPCFIWDDSTKEKIISYNGSNQLKVTGAAKLCVFFPAPSPNGEYPSISIVGLDGYYL